MKLMKKIIAAVIALILTFSITGCHEKNEVAVTVNGFEYTSAYYMCALIDAYMEGQNEVYNALSSTATGNIDYFKQKINGKKFDVWVKDRAIEILKEIGTYQKLCADAGLKITDELKSNAEYTALVYWNYYGYADLYNPNGVSYETYLKYMTDSSYYQLYFEHLYGEGGSKEISNETLEEKLYKDFIIADMLEVTFSSETDKEKEEIKTKFEKYLADLKDGKMTFEEVYNDYNKSEEETKEDADHDHEDAETSDEDKDTEEDEEKKPLDEYATILGAKDTGYENDYFDEINKMATDEIKLITKADGKGYILVVKKDIKADPYYRENLDSTVRHLLKDEEYEADMAKLFPKAKVEINNYAVDRFKVKEIKEPQY